MSPTQHNKIPNDGRCVMGIQIGVGQASHLTAGVVVEGERVDGAAGDTSERTRGGDRSDIGAELLRILGALGCQEVGPEAGDVGRGHGGAGDGVLYYESYQSQHIYAQNERKKRGGCSGEEI